MIELTHEQRVAHLQKLIDEDNILRNKWAEGARQAGGYDRACLLAALAPEVVPPESPGFCPAWLMPIWMAELIPQLDDDVSEEAWPVMIRKFAQLAGQWQVLTEDDWDEVLRDIQNALMDVYDEYCQGMTLQELQDAVDYNKRPLNPTPDDQTTAAIASSLLTARESIMTAPQNMNAIGSVIVDFESIDSMRGHAKKLTTKPNVWDRAAFIIFLAIDKAIQAVS